MWISGPVHHLSFLYDFFPLRVLWRPLFDSCAVLPHLHTCKSGDNIDQFFFYRLIVICICRTSNENILVKNLLISRNEWTWLNDSKCALIWMASGTKKSESSVSFALTKQKKKFRNCWNFSKDGGNVNNKWKMIYSFEFYLIHPRNSFWRFRSIWKIFLKNLFRLNYFYILNSAREYRIRFKLFLKNSISRTFVILMALCGRTVNPIE